MTAPNVLPAGQKRKKPKKRPRQNWSAQCDVLFSKLVRAPGRCVCCGSTQGIQCMHGFSRRYRAIRWDFRNAFAGCQACHMKYTHNPLAWDDWLLARWGVDLYSELRRLALSGARVDTKARLVELRALEARAA